MGTLTSLRLTVKVYAGAPLVSASDAGCGCCCGTGPVLGGPTVSDEPQVCQSPQEASELLLRISRSLAAQALALNASGPRDPRRGHHHPGR